MSDFGTDISVVGGLNFSKRLTGTALLGQALANRYQTPRGALFYDPTYGYDLRQLLNRKLTGDDIYAEQAAIAGEAEKDERILSADASLTQTAPDAFEVEVECDTADGPFTLVLAVSALTVEVLNVDIGG